MAANQAETTELQDPNHAEDFEAAAGADDGSSHKGSVLLKFLNYTAAER